MERILLLAKIERGIKQADQGETISHQAVKDRMAKWLNYTQARVVFGFRFRLKTLPE